MPIVEEDKQNTSTLSSEVMTSLVSWNKKLERMIFILSAVGLRIGEAPGIEINKRLSPDFLTIYIKQNCITAGSNSGSDSERTTSRRSTPSD